MTGNLIQGAKKDDKRTHHLAAVVGADHLIGGFDGDYWPRFLVEHKATVRYGAMKVFYDRFRLSLLRDWGPEDHPI